MVTRHIVAMGGGGFSREPENPLMDDFILGLTGKAEPKVCSVPTAQGDADSYLLRFYQAFAARRCRPTHLGLFHRTVDDIRRFVLEQDVIYVAGGNTANLLAVWRVHGLDSVLREAWDAGIVLCGTSAGALCWFSAGVTDSFGTALAPLHDGLGFLPGSHCPHYDGDRRRRPSYHRFVAEGLPAGVAADDGCGLHFVGTELVEVVTSQQGAQAYRVAPAGNGDGVTEIPLLARFLG